MRLIRILSWGALGALLILSVAAYAGLPESIPAHIGLEGRVTRYETKSIIGWFLLPAIALATHLLIQGIGAMLPSRPHWFNFPDKARLLLLPRAYQASVIEEMRSMLDVTTLGVSTMMLVIQYQMWRAAFGEGSPGTMLMVAILPVVLSPAILLWFSRVTTALEREEARWKSAGSPAP